MEVVFSKMAERGKYLWRSLLCVPALAAAIFAVYSGSLGGSFVYDDIEQIMENRWIRDFSNLPGLFVSDSAVFRSEAPVRYYRPLMLILYMAEFKMFGLVPWGWHLVNILLHAANAAMVFFAAREVFKRYGDWTASLFPPFAVAAIFALHPVNNEAVSWAACVPELLYAFFCLAALYLYMKAADRGWPFTIPSAVLFFLALTAKETAVALPVIVVLHDLFLKKGEGVFSRRRLKRYAPFAVAFAAYMALRINSFGFNPSETMYPYLSAFQFFINAVILFIKYLMALALPLSESPFQLLDPARSVAEPWAVFSILTVAALAAGLFALRKKVHPIALFAIGVIVVPLLPALYIPGLSRHPFADRYLYFPTIGLGLLSGLFFNWAMASGFNRKALGAALALVSVLYGYGAHARSLDWRDELTLWNASLEGSAETNYFAHFMAGSELLRRGEAAVGVENLKRALAIIDKSPHPDPHIRGLARLNLATGLRSMGRDVEALREYEEVLKSSPGHAVALYEAASIYQAGGDYRRAVEYYASAIEAFKRPEDRKDAYVNMGNCLVRIGEREGAMAAYEAALRIDPYDRAALNNLRYARGGM